MTDKQHEKEEFRKLIDVFSTDVSAFAKYVFNSTLTDKQIEFANAFRDNHMITVRGGSGAGKTHVEGILIWWCLLTMDQVQVTIFGPSEPQIRGGIYKELLLLHDRMHSFFKEGYDVQATRISRRINPSSCFAEYRLANADRPDAARGIHQKNNIVIVDEASGVDDSIFEVLLNILTDPNPKLCLVSNPSKASGFFWRTHCDPDISSSWAKIHLRMHDAPHFKPETLPLLVANYGGPTARQTRVMVWGEFPLSDVDGLISREFIDAAVLNEDCVPADNVPVVWGLDPAGAGKDKSVLCIRHDNKLLGFEEWQGLEPTPLAYKVRELFEKTAKKDRPAVISVDATGLGNGVYSILKDWGLPVHACIFAGTPTRSPDRYSRIRDQLWWEMREWIHSENVNIPNHQRLIEELATPTYDDSSGKIKLEDKKAMKKRLGGRSPDFADALAITFAVSKTRYASKYSWSQKITYDHLQSLE